MERAARLTEHPGWVILLSGGLAGWLMGLLSWLVAASRDTVSQILFVWMIAGVIALGHLHHCISGTIEVMAATISPGIVGAADFAHFLGWTTAGNVAGSFMFAVLIHYSELITGQAKGGKRTSRGGSRPSGHSETPEPQ